jgi:6-phosphogluconolactonase
MTVSLPNLTVLPDADAVATTIAQRIVTLSRTGSGPAVSIALAGGSTPQRLYRLLASPEIARQVDWTRIHLFWGDERLVPADHSDSNTRMVKEALLDHVAIPQANVHLVATGAGTPEQAAAAYEDTLKRHYGAPSLSTDRPLFDLVILGMGDDGHTASLFPGKPAIHEQERWVASVPEAGMTPYVPRISLTFPAIASSRQVAILVTGAGKNATLQRVAAGEDLPIRKVTSLGSLAWYLDAAAAGA